MMRARHVAALTGCVVLAAALVIAVAGGGGETVRPAAAPVTTPATAVEPAPAQGRTRDRRRADRPARRDRRRAAPAPARSLSATIEDRLGGRTPSAERTVIASSCRGDTCVARFRSVPRGQGVVVRRARAIARSVLDRAAGVDRVILYAHHQTVGRKKDERPAFLAVDCTAPPLRCRARHQAGGRQRSLIRRGELSVQDATQARGR